MIAVAVDLGAMQSLSARDTQTIGTLLDLRSHGAQVLRDRGDAIALLVTQFGRIADLDALGRVGRDRRQHRQLVDHSGSLRTFDSSSAQCSAHHADRSRQLAMTLFYVRSEEHTS